MRTDRVVEEDVPGPWAGCAGKRSGPWPPLRLIGHSEAPLRNFAALPLETEPDWHFARDDARLRHGKT